jgi:hypothetical protein
MKNPTSPLSLSHTHIHTNTHNFSRSLLYISCLHPMCIFEQLLTLLLEYVILSDAFSATKLHAKNTQCLVHGRAATLRARQPGMD